MSKQLSGSLFVDIQGDNKNFKKSIDQSEKQVQAFSTTLTQTLGNNPVFNALVGSAASFVAFRKGRQLHRNFQGMRASGALGQRAINQDIIRTARAAHPSEFGPTDEDSFLNEAQRQSTIARAKENLNRTRRQAAEQKLARRRIIKDQPMRDTIRFAATRMGAFLTSAAGVATIAGAVLAVGAFGMKQMFDRGKEAQVFNADQYKQDALTKIARIKQNIAIAKGTQLEGYAGGGARFRQRQSANAAAGYATAGNVASGTWDYAIGVLNWFMAGGLPGAIGRVTIGGGSFI